MICKRYITVVLIAVMALLMTACASAPQYALDDRAPVEATAPLDLPAWPDGVLIVCPRGPSPRAAEQGVPAAQPGDATRGVANRASRLSWLKPSAGGRIPAEPGALLLASHGDPKAHCPSGTEWIAYDSAAADTLHEYAIAGDANSEIASLQYDQILALDQEADALNDNAARLEGELAAEQRGRSLERLGWIGSLAAIIALAL